MGNAIEKILEKLAAYEIINNIIPGAIYVVLTDRLTRFSVQIENVFSNLVIYFFVGVVIGRIGSLIIEPILRHKTKKGRAVIKFAPYDEFVTAEKLDKTGRLKELSAINNMYRVLTSTMFCLFITIIIGYLWDSVIVKFKNWILPIVIFALMIVFVFSYRKQTDYVKKRIKTVLKDEHIDTLAEMLKK